MFEGCVRVSGCATTGYDDVKIPVIFATGQVGHVNGHTLDYLIREKEIVAFSRSEGWVHLGRDLIRSAQQPLARPDNRRDDFQFKLPKR